MGPFVFADPSFVDLVDRDRIEEMQLLPAVPDHREEVGGFENLEMLGHGLAGHIEMGAEFRECPPIRLLQLIEKVAAAGIGEGFEHVVHR